MFKNQLLSILYKEYRILLNRIKSYLFAVLMGYAVILLIMWSVLKNSAVNVDSNNLLILYSTVYMGFLSFLYAMRYWEEKITGTMEYSFVLNMSIRRIILLKNIAYLIFGNVLLIIFFVISSVIFFQFSISNLLITIIVYILLAFPYGLINGSGMWCLKSGAAKVLQLISMGIIFSSIGIIWKVKDVNTIGYFLPLFLTFDGLLWIISIILFLKADKEKAIVGISE